MGLGNEKRQVGIISVGAKQGGKNGRGTERHVVFGKVLLQVDTRGERRVHNEFILKALEERLVHIL